MKSIISLITILISTLTTYPQSFRLEPIPSTTIPVTVDKMTNLVFPEAIESGVKVSAEITAQKAHGADNVIEIKALRRHFTTTNFTAYGKDGRLYSFVLKYVDDTDILNFRICPDSGAIIQLSGLPSPMPTLRQDARQLESQPSRLHSSTRTDRLSLRLNGVYAKDSLEWLIFHMANHSTLDFHPETVRFFLQDRRRARRRAIQEIDLQPVYQDTPQKVTRATSATFATSFNPFYIGKNKRLICEYREKDGRILSLKLSHRRASRAISWPQK